MSRSDRTEDEWAALRVEAERRVRAGEVAARVAKEMGVAMPTLQHWQAEDGWRLKDIRHEALTGERMPRPVWLAANALRGKTGANPLPADYVHRVETARARVAVRDAELKAARQADAGEAGRVAMGEAARLYEAGEVERADKTARLAERFIRMDRRLKPQADTGAREAPPPEEAKPALDPLDDPDNPDRTYRDRVAERLRALLARLDREEAALMAAQEDAAPFPGDEN